MTRTTQVALTVLVALALVVMLAGFLALATFGPVFTLIALAGMAANGFAASDVIGQIWKLEGQCDDETC